MAALPVDFGGATCTTSAAGALITSSHNPATRPDFLRLLINLILCKLPPSSFHLRHVQNAMIDHSRSCWALNWDGPPDKSIASPIAATATSYPNRPVGSKLLIGSPLQK